MRIFRVRAMECVCAQTSPRCMLSSERVLENGVRTHVNSKGKISSPGGSDEGQIRDSASSRTASPTHYRLSYSGPTVPDRVIAVSAETFKLQNPFLSALNRKWLNFVLKIRKWPKIKILEYYISQFRQNENDILTLIRIF